MAAVYEAEQLSLGKKVAVKILASELAASTIVIERFFRDLTDKRLRRGIFPSVPQLIEAICNYVEGHNADPRPVVWTKTAREILAKVGRAKIALIRAQQAASHH